MLKSFQAENRAGGIFRSNWSYIGHVHQFSSSSEAGKYICGSLGSGLPVVITQAGDALNGYINLCRHRAAVLLDRDEKDVQGHGCGAFGSHMVCKYHGWQYAPNGRLARAVSMKGIQNFSAREQSLLPLDVKTLGPFIFAKCPDIDSAMNTPPGAATGQGDGSGQALDEQPSSVLIEQVQSVLGALSDYSFVGRHSYDIKCNWKVFADNYLDGGYHIARLHPGLASQLDLKSYATRLFPGFSVQTCSILPPEQRRLAGNEVVDRVGPPLYVWMFPNTAINKYGPWIDVHTVLPRSPSTCTVIFDYFLQQQTRATLSADAIAAQLRASCDVQQEDIDICERVQVGLSSGGYQPGRYGGPECASHHFHTLLARSI